jgi:hypothetical protein
MPTDELLADRGNRTATIEEYVEAAKILTRLRRYRQRLAVVAAAESSPGFNGQWWEAGLWRKHNAFSELLGIDAMAGEMNELIEKIDTLLRDPIWANVEQEVQGATTKLIRSEVGAVACIPDRDGQFLSREGHLVRGTREELARAERRWTPLHDVLPPLLPHEEATAAGPGVA